MRSALHADDLCALRGQAVCTGGSLRRQAPVSASSPSDLCSRQQASHAIARPMARSLSVLAAVRPRIRRPARMPGCYQLGRRDDGPGSRQPALPTSIPVIEVLFRPVPRCVFPASSMPSGELEFDSAGGAQSSHAVARAARRPGQLAAAAGPVGRGGQARRAWAATPSPLSRRRGGLGRELPQEALVAERGEGTAHGGRASDPWWPAGPGTRSHSVPVRGRQGAGSRARDLRRTVGGPGALWVDQVSGG